MKNILRAFLLAGILAATLPYCKKDNSKSGNTEKPVLTLSKTTVERGEPLTVSTVANSSSVVKWTVYPAGNSLISAALRSSSVLFSSAGGYIITASYFADSGSTAPYDSASSPVTVTDSVYTPPLIDHEDTLSLAGDQLMLQPYWVSDSAGLVINVQTKNVYNCSPIFIGYGYSVDNGTLKADFKFISDPASDCGGFQNHAIAALFYPSLTNGDYPISILFNDTEYQGSVNVSGSTYTFTWPYISGVVMAPLTIQKQ